MKSSDIGQLSSWESWPDPALAKAPETPGVYIFRLSKCFGRMQGASDIVYIGLAKKRIKERLAGHRRTAISSLSRVLRDSGALQVAWKSCSKQSDAAVVESRLLGKYVREHIELPPLNRQQSLESLQQYFKAVSQLSNAPIDDQLEERGLTAFQQLEEMVRTRPKPHP